jgi:hypothetical protein
MDDDEKSNVVDLRPCDTEPPCESIPKGYSAPEKEYKAPEVDMVNSPPHYKRGAYELVDIIEHIVQDYPSVKAYHIATVIKYLGRAPYKGTLDRDMKKAFWHLRRAIQCNQK